MDPSPPLRRTEKERWGAYVNFKKTLFPAFILAIICFTCAVALAVTHAATKERIAKVEYDRYVASAKAVMPEGAVLTALDVPGIDGFVAANAEGDTIGYVIRTSAKGYGGDVICVVGFDTDGKILGLSVRAPDETPGLGNNVHGTAFTDQFLGAEKPPVLSEDVDGVTGATYSSRAVISAVNEAFEKLTVLRKGEN